MQKVANFFFLHSIKNELNQKFETLVTEKGPQDEQVKNCKGLVNYYRRNHCSKIINGMSLFSLFTFSPFPIPCIII